MGHVLQFSLPHTMRYFIWHTVSYCIIGQINDTSPNTQSIRTDAIITTHISLLEIKDVHIITLLSCRCHGHFAHQTLLWRIWIQILITLPGMYLQSSAANKLFSDTIHFTQVRLRHLILVFTDLPVQNCEIITSNPGNAESQLQVRQVQTASNIVRVGV